ncbi:hypothetical protein [Undibacterium terreum]|uniref:Uncharacterized protein n=1 Tax=Undibacterium terreum TaxID=1224302 RepID=A0A916XMR8_9BURK|nr:hypothetical protein [Undibacterium terreum]GGC87685.1 hypothetical protein GCM10011396_38640 [Undibacterium terreum]
MSDEILVEKNKDFASECYEQITDALLDLGFKRVRLGVFAFEISPNIYAWLGLNRVRKSSVELELYPVIGVVHVEVNDIVYLRTNTKKDLSPTVSVPICYLLAEGKYRTWTWRKGSNEASVTSDLKKVVQLYGLPFLDRFSSVEKLYQEFYADEFNDEEARLTVNMQRVVPAAMLLTNRMGAIESYLKKQKHANDALGGDSDFEIFANQLMQRAIQRH